MSKVIYLLGFLVLALIGSLFLFVKYGSPDIAGPDANRDGIRDDVEKLIDQKYAETPRKRAAARALAKQIQKSIVDPKHADLQEGLKADGCLHLAFGQASYNVLTDLEAATANSMARTRALIKFCARFNGKVIEVRNISEQECREFW